MGLAGRVYCDLSHHVSVDMQCLLTFLYLPLFSISVAVNAGTKGQTDLTADSTLIWRGKKCARAQITHFLTSCIMVFSMNSCGWLGGTLASYLCPGTADFGTKNV